MMNKLIVFILAISSSLISYWIGAKVGFDKAWIYSQGLNMNKAAHDLVRKKEIIFHNIEDHNRFIDNANRAKIQEGLMIYGEYISKWTSIFPSPNNVQSTILDCYKFSAKIYRDHVFDEKKYQTPEEVVEIIEAEMSQEGKMDIEIWEIQKKLLLEELKKKEFYVNSAVNSLIID